MSIFLRLSEVRQSQSFINNIVGRNQRGVIGGKPCDGSGMLCSRFQAMEAMDVTKIGDRPEWHYVNSILSYLPMTDEVLVSALSSGDMALVVVSVHVVRNGWGGGAFLLEQRIVN